MKKSRIGTGVVFFLTLLYGQSTCVQPLTITRTYSWPPGVVINIANDAFYAVPDGPLRTAVDNWNAALGVDPNSPVLVIGLGTSSSQTININFTPISPPTGTVTRGLTYTWPH